MCSYFISALFYDIMISKVEIKIKNLYNFNLLLIIKLYKIFMNLSFQINLQVLIFLSILIHLSSGKYEIDYRISDQIFVILLQNFFIERHCFLENTPVIVYLVIAPSVVHVLLYSFLQSENNRNFVVHLYRNLNTLTFDRLKIVIQKNPVFLFFFFF